MKKTEARILVSEENKRNDKFFSQDNIKYLEKIKRDIDSGKAHFAEHKLIDN